MAIDGSTFLTTLAAAAGDDPLLMEELRRDFVASVERQADLLGRARCDGNWRLAAQRLKGLGASFHLSELEQLADEALAAAPGEPTVVRKLARLCRELTASG